MADVTISELTNRQPNSFAVFPYSEGDTTYNAALSNILPKGLISMWYGSIATIPSGWALCDGTNGTPNLRDRFIVGAGTTYSPGNTGGLSAVTLTSAQIPAHSHGYSYMDANYGGYLGSSQGYSPKGTLTSATTNNNTGGGGSHENRPPYYALAYIMKL